MDGLYPDSWRSEIAASTLSVIFLTALAALLAIADGRTVHSVHHLTLNTVVSVLSTSSKATAVYVLSQAISQEKWTLFSQQAQPLYDFESIDAASRSEWGCVRLIRRMRASTFICIGALATIIALIFDPFAQQLVQYQDKVIYSSDIRATLPTARRYSAGTEFFNQLAVDPASSASQQACASADFSMQSAVLYGLNNDMEDVVQGLCFRCPSGNCTWTPTQSLAVCSTCSDLSSRLTKTDVNPILPEALPLDIGSGPSLAALHPGDERRRSSFSGTNFSLPNGLWLDNYNGFIYGMDFKLEGNISAGVYMTTFGSGNGSMTNSFQDLDTLIWSETILRVRPDPRNASAVWPDLPVEATECALHYCVNEYESEVVSGTLVEGVQPILSATRSPDSWQFVNPAPTGNLSMSQNSTLQFNNHMALRRTDLRLGNDFNISQAAVDGISAFFQLMFIAKEPVLSPNTTGIINGYYIDNGNIQHFPSIMQPLSATKDFGATFAAVAASMSNAMRAGSDGGTRVAGMNGATVTTYRVAWPWILLPLGVVLASVLQLSISIYHSTRAEAPLWKSSSLAILSRGLYTHAVLDGAPSVRSMETVAKENFVNIFPTSMTFKSESRTRLKEGAQSFVSEAAPTPSLRSLSPVRSVSPMSLKRF